MNFKSKNNTQNFRYAQLITLLTMTITSILGFIIPLSTFQSLVIMPLFLLLQIGLLAYLEIKFDKADKNPEVYYLSEKSSGINCNCKQAA